MLGKKKQQEDVRNNNINQNQFFKSTTIKELIAPSGIDATDIDHLEIISNTKRYARSFFISSLPNLSLYLTYTCQHTSD